VSTLVIGGNGFIGRRLVPLLAERGEEVVCMDVDPRAASFEHLGSQLRMVRGDVSQFDDVMSALRGPAKPQRIVNLAYSLGSEHPPHRAFKLNILGMENCFEAARLADVGRVVFASSLAVNGPQRRHGERHVTEDDGCHGMNQYATHKIFNERQAEDYRAKHGLEITAVRPANVTGSDKVLGSVDHVCCITQSARGKPAAFRYRDFMRCPIHVDEVAEIFARVVLTDKPAHPVYNTGGFAVSLGEIAELVRGYLPDARIDFDRETGGQDPSNESATDCYLIDNGRLLDEFALRYRPYSERVLQIINEIRHQEGLPLVADTYAGQHIL
jgi:nucleoside-diphosphate-sugar epimerase